MSQTTKRALAASLKKLLSEKSLAKTTVIDIVTECEVNRQTFYYHFHDIYDLIEWIYTSEATRALDGNKTYNTWQEGFLKILEYILENKDFVQNIYHSISRQHLETYLYHETHHLIMGVIEEKAAGMTVRDDDKAFIADFYKYGFVGLMLEWIQQGMKEEPGTIIDRLSILIQGNIEKDLEKFKKPGS
ncbi:TetR/AcrR family transcriptional regulator [Acetobacterium sp.]|uniref:TetR/AcrR family transcriptional regulator n=1 Tax=Acetobacterium sp. TaxID=1872094 RepID=UPI002F3ECE80